MAALFSCRFGTGSAGAVAAGTSVPQSAGMIAASALILLAQAVAACAPGSPSLDGGAVLVRPVGTFEPVPFERLGPTDSVVTRPTDVQQTAAPAQAEPQPEADPAPDRCSAPVFPIA